MTPEAEVTGNMSEAQTEAMQRLEEALSAKTGENGELESPPEEPLGIERRRR